MVTDDIRDLFLFDYLHGNALHRVEPILALFGSQQSLLFLLIPLVLIAQIRMFYFLSLIHWWWKLLKQFQGIVWMDDLVDFFDTVQVS